MTFYSLIGRPLAHTVHFGFEAKKNKTSRNLPEEPQTQNYAKQSFRVINKSFFSAERLYENRRKIPFFLETLWIAILLISFLFFVVLI